MLPWDRLAQFTVVATAEWLDCAAGVQRHADAQLHLRGRVNDRLFSLLSFLHIGAAARGAGRAVDPHAARAAGADRCRRGRSRSALTVALVVLSLVKPALSQGGPPTSRRRHDARLRLVLPADLRAALPLVAGRGVVAGGRRDAALPAAAVAAAAGAAAARSTCSSTPTTASCRCARARRCSTPRCARACHALRLPQRRLRRVQGARSLLRRGRLRRLPGERLTDAERAAGKVLACCATPLADVEIEYVPTETPRQRPGARLHGRASRRWTALARRDARAARRWRAASASRSTPASTSTSCCEDGEKRSFSFATAPHVARAHRAAHPPHRRRALHRPTCSRR